jgi:hypothetical protein
MSKVFGAVAKVAGVVASVAQFIPGGQAIAAIAGAVSLVSGTLAQVTAKPPKAVGQVTNITIGANQPIPYMIGRSYSGGAMVHDIGYGGVVSDVDNPYRAMTIVYSGAGPIQALVATQADFADAGFSGTAATGYYAGFLWRDWLDGTGPAPRALAAQFAGEPNWSSAHKLSGFFGVKYTLKFDKKGKVWQAGVPQFGVIADGVRAYDPRLDSTFPGGSGAQRINNEATWAFTKNPALHALAYSYGRYQNGKKVFGVDLGASAIDLASVATWANVCAANGWEANGTIYEPGDKWNNLKLICEAGGGVPVPGARLRFDYNAAGVSVDTITIHDLADGEISLPVTQGYASRINTVQGVYTSPDHRWEPVPTDKIVDTAALAADGEEKAEQFPFQMVTAKNQAAQLAAYKMANAREKGPIVIPVKARLLTYPVGTFLTAQLPAIGMPSQKVKIIGKRRTMEDGSGEITVLTETDAKHAFALAATSGAPPSSALVSPERLDELAISLATPQVTYDNVFPAVANAGQLHFIQPGNIPWKRLSGGLIIEGVGPIAIHGIEPDFGWLRLQDADIPAAQATADEAIAALAALDDDGVVTIDEKIRILIPRAAALEGAYQALLPLATTRGISTTAVTTKRTAWLAALAAITPLWNDTSVASIVTRGSLDTALQQYSDELELLNKEIAAFATRNVNRGAWSGSSVAYVIGDIVDRSGSSYAATVNHTSSGANGPPGANWTLQASAGASGGTGATGPVAPTISCSPPAWPIACTFNGTPKAAVPGFQINVFQGTTNVSATASYGTVASSGISGAAVSSGGAVTVSGMTADSGYVEVPVTYAGVTMLARVDYTKVRDGNAAVSGSANVTSLVNTGTYASSANFNVSLANGQTFNANANVSYDAASSTYRPQIKLAYLNVTDSGSETDMSGSEVLGGTAIPTDFQTASTSGSFTNSSGGTKVFNIRLLTRRSSGAGNSANVTGSVGGSG